VRLVLSGAEGRSPDFLFGEPALPRRSPVLPPASRLLFDFAFDFAFDFSFISVFNSVLSLTLLCLCISFEI
jgi:hypothetical protein